MLSMMDAGQGILAFRSSMKGSVKATQPLFNKEGTAPAEGYVSHELRYSDFGLQLDIAPVSKLEVTVSTQRQRIEFYDIFNSGKITKDPHLKELHDEYMSTINDIVRMKREEIIKAFGLVWYENRNAWGLPEGETIKTFQNKLEGIFEHRLMPYNILEGIELALLPENEPNTFDSTVSKFKIEEVLMAELRNGVISRKTMGDMLIQESSAIYDSNLKFYRMEDGKVKAMQIMIALPKDLIDYVENIGGLDVFNEAIRTHDTKLLGREFFKILTIPMNRIPSQKLSTLEVAEIVKFLPSYYGNKVVLPKEIVAKAGSDFDVDKLTSYFNNYEIEKKVSEDGVETFGKVRYYTDMSTIKGKENRLNEISIEAYLNPERFKEIITPLETDRLKDIAIELRDESYNDRTPLERKVIDLTKDSDRGIYDWGNVISWWYNVQKGKDFFKVKPLMAGSAINNVAHANYQSTPVRARAFAPLFFEGFQLSPDEYYINGFIKDAEGTYISDNTGGLISAIVDYVKDQYVFNLIDDKAYNAMSFLNTYGITSGVGFQSIVDSFNQPAVIKYLQENRRNQPRFMMSNLWTRNGIYKGSNIEQRVSVRDQYAKTVGLLKKELSGTETNIPTMYKNTVTAAFQDLLDFVDKTLPDESLSPKDYNDAIVKLEQQLEPYIAEVRNRIEKYDYKFFKPEELSSEAIRTSFKDQVQLLDNFLMYQTMGSELVTLNMFLRPDARSGMYRHISAVEGSVHVPKVHITRRGFFNTQDINDAILGAPGGNTSLLKEFYNTKAQTAQIFGFTSIIHKDPIIKEFFRENVYEVLGNPKRYMKKVDLDKAYATIESDFINFVLTYMFEADTKEQLQSVYKGLFVGDESVPQRLLTLKGTLPDNQAIQKLEPRIAESINRTKALSEVDNIATFNSGLEIHEIDAIESDLYDLATESPDEDIRKFVENLIEHSVYQSGLQSPINSYLELMPNRLFVAKASRALQKFISLPTAEKEDLLDNFLDQMYRNSAENQLIVPRSGFPGKMNKTDYRDKGEVRDKTGKILKYGFFSHYDYIAFNAYPDNPGAYIKLGITPPAVTVLFKRQKGTNYFVRINKLGEGTRFKEFYPMVGKAAIDKASIIESNYYILQLLNQTFDESPLAFKDGTNENDSSNNPVDDEIAYDPSDDSENTEEETPPDDKDSETSQPDLNNDFAETLLKRGYNSKIEDLKNNNFYVGQLGPESKLQRALSLIERRTGNAALADLAKVVRKVLDRKAIPLYIHREWETENERAKKYFRDHNVAYRNGLYTASVAVRGKGFANEKVEIYEKLSNVGFEITATHEAIHALSQFAYEYDEGFRDKIDRLYNYTRKYIVDNKIDDKLLQTLTKDATEFMSYGMSRSDFQSFLAAIPAENPEVTREGLKQLSVLSQFFNTLFDLIRKYFNIQFVDIPDKAARLNGMMSVMHDLVILVDEEIINQQKKSAEVNEDGILVQIEIPNTVITPNHEVIIEHNMLELGKETENIEDFEKLYPDYDYLEDIEKETFNKAVNDGLIELSCGF
jgi:hypothetical protein